VSASVPEARAQEQSASFLPLVTGLVTALQARGSGWRVQAGPAPAQDWIRVCNDRLAVPQQGWKLHISASVVCAEETLRRVLPVLLAEDASFKLAGSYAMLDSLNHGDGRLSQVGKFITVYPNDDRQAVRLAVALDTATRGLEGPTIPSDRPLAPSSLVHYRYGGFGDQFVQTPLGEILPALMAPDGTLIPDRRRTHYSPPSWARDPFIEAGVSVDLPAWEGNIGERYIAVTTLHRSPRGMVYLAIDLAEGRRCILKRALRAGSTGEDGQDACDRLRHEAEVLKRLAPHSGFPAFYDLAEDGGDLYLAMEDIDGITLEAHIAGIAGRGRLLSTQELVALGRQLTALLAAVHAACFVYRDLKSPNVIVTPNGRLRLIDFELAHELAASQRPFGYGTRGYVSPQQAAGEHAAITDDVYGLGALLYFMATTAEPSLAPREFALLNRPLSLLNPALDPALETVIARCLDRDPSRRFPSIDVLDAALAAIPGGRRPRPQPFAGAQVIVDGNPRHRYADLARRLGDTLCAVSQPAPDGQGRLWISAHSLSAGAHSRDINVGSAGPVLALADLVAAFDCPEHRATLADGARWLLAAPPLAGRPLPGLYVGEAGVGAAILRAGQVLGDRSLIAAAEARGRLLAAQPFGCPDLFNGTAGRLQFHLWLWDQTGTEEHLRAAGEAGVELLAATERVEDGPEHALRWPIPPGYEGLSGTAPLGYAHGAAGIADALLDLFEATGDEHYLAAAQGAGRWLARQAIPSLNDGSGLDWPSVEGGTGIRFWCHGSAGIGRFFLHMARLNAMSGADELARGAARAVAHGARAAGPVQCHGLSGNLEFLLDQQMASDDAETQVAIASLARLLEAFAGERDGLLVFPSESPWIFTPDYMVGYAGVAVCLLRLSDPRRWPHQLSRQGFWPAYSLHSQARAVPRHAGPRCYSSRERG
jgi:serine/threonine protein kinase